MKRVPFVVLALSVSSANTAVLVPPCTHSNKQTALYLDYDLEPSLKASPAVDVSIEHIWNSTADMRRYGKNGVFAAQPVGFANGLGGYFGSQADADPSSGGLIFSIWDSGRKNGSASYPCSAAPNKTWCSRVHTFPLTSNCRRHCLDCGLHPGWKNTTGTQCNVPMELVEGRAHLKFRLYRSANTSVLRNPLGMGLHYIGSEWTLEASNATSGKMWTVGKMFFEDLHSGIIRFGAFHEHIGCTPCSAFYESEIRVGPYDVKTATGAQRNVEHIRFQRKNVSCELYNVNISLTKGIPSAQFFTGPGTGRVNAIRSAT